MKNPVKPLSTRSRPDTHERNFIVRLGFFFAVVQTLAAPSFAATTLSMALAKRLSALQYHVRFTCRRASRIRETF